MKKDKVEYSDLQKILFVQKIDWANFYSEQLDNIFYDITEFLKISVHGRYQEFLDFLKQDLSDKTNSKIIDLKTKIKKYKAKFYRYIDSDSLNILNEIHGMLKEFERHESLFRAYNKDAADKADQELLDKYLAKASEVAFNITHESAIAEMKALGEKLVKNYDFDAVASTIVIKHIENYFSHKILHEIAGYFVERFKLPSIKVSEANIRMIVSIEDAMDHYEQDNSFDEYYADYYIEVRANFNNSRLRDWVNKFKESKFLKPEILTEVADYLKIEDFN